MRTIKFRGIRSGDGEWIYGYYRCINWEIDKPTYQIINGNSFFTVIPESVGQFTGLQDSKGKDIYEGDICKTLTNRLPQVIDMIVFIDGCFVLNGGIPINVNKLIEIIGNIHENPELL